MLFRSLQTDGFSRDVAIENNTAYVATGQYGIQVWDLQNQSLSAGFTGYEEGGAFLEFEDPTLIGRDETNKLIFVSEPGKDVKIFHYDGGDSIFYRNTIMSAKTKGFVSFPSETDQFIILATVQMPFIIVLVWHAWHESFDRHKRLARWIWPVWMFVSVSGVVVYLMLYKL